MKSRNNLFLMIAIVFALIFAGVVFMTASSMGTAIDEGLANWADGKSETVLASIMKVASIIGSSEVIMLITDRKSTRLNSSHVATSYAVFCLKKKKSIIIAPSSISV